MCKVIGIDISKQTFDVCIRKERKLAHLIFENNPKGFKKFLQSPYLFIAPYGSLFLLLIGKILSPVQKHWLQ